MSDPDRLFPEVLANLRAIRAGEPWPCPEIAVPAFAAISPTDFVSGSTWMLPPDGAAVLALADERDALRKVVNVQANLVMLPESSVEAMKELYRNEQPESHYMAPDWAVEPEPDALGERPPMRLTQAGKAWLAERVARMSNVADARVNALDLRVREIFTAPITAEEGIERLVRDRDALRKRVADFEHLLTEPRVEREPLLALRDIMTRLYVSAFGYATIGEAETKALQDQVLTALPDVLDEALAANTFRRLNKGVAGALGLLEMQKDPKTGESYLPSWHDLPERVAALVREGEALQEKVKALTDERAALLAPVEGAGDDLDALVDMTCEDPKHDDLWCPTCEEYPRIRALAREVIRLRMALRLADEQSAEAIKRVSSEVVADKWNSTAELQQKVKALTTDLKHVEHALGDRIKPGQTLERVIADLIADLDRAGVGVGTQKPAER